MLEIYIKFIICTETEEQTSLPSTITYKQSVPWNARDVTLGPENVKNVRKCRDNSTIEQENVIAATK